MFTVFWSLYSTNPEAAVDDLLEKVVTTGTWMKISCLLPCQIALRCTLHITRRENEFRDSETALKDDFHNRVQVLKGYFHKNQIDLRLSLQGAQHLKSENDVLRSHLHIFQSQVDMVDRQVDQVEAVSDLSIGMEHLIGRGYV